LVIGHLIAALHLAAGQSLRRWLFHLGGIGLIPLGLLDNSPIPIPGAMDVATILLSARQSQLWIYYCLMATAGSLLGGFLTYRLARKGGKEALERKFSRRKADRIYKTFERWGFSAIAIPALLPPPMPMVPFLFAAGALQYPVKKFLVALTLGRLARYAILAYLGARYGRQILGLVTRHVNPVVVGVIVAVIVAGGLVLYFRNKPATTKAKRRK
jgi:membrane protein DedA with SNARE-associated domain